MPRFNFAAVLQFVLAVRDHDVAGIQTGRDPGNVPVRFGERDKVDFHLVIRADREHVRPLGATQYGGRRHQHHVFLRVHQQVHVHKLVGK